MHIACPNCNTSVKNMDYMIIWVLTYWSYLFYFDYPAQIQSYNAIKISLRWTEKLQQRICWVIGYGGCPSQSLPLSLSLMPSASDDITRAKLTQHSITGLFIGSKIWGYIWNRTVIVIAERRIYPKACKGWATEFTS